MIKYTILKAVQVLAFITLPILMFDYMRQGGIENYFLFIIDLYILELFLETSMEQTLEKKLHGELY
mgnify:FL=1|tara:strand:+ start:2348 stop:2545 length:198 start_codon:yes stop_codon:yes gene_type:complete